jgi:hypothetical protein
VIFLSVFIATSISMHVFPFLLLIIIPGRFAITALFVCTPWFSHIFIFTYWLGCVCVCVCGVCVCVSFFCLFDT